MLKLATHIPENAYISVLDQREAKTLRYPACKSWMSVALATKTGIHGKIQPIAPPRLGKSTASDFWTPVCLKLNPALNRLWSWRSL